MNINKFCIALLAAFFCTAPAFAQVPSVNDFSFTMVMNEGGGLSHTYTVQIPVTEQVEQAYNVEVPYTEQVETADGRIETVTKTRTETRTRMVTMTKMVMEERMRMVDASAVTTVGGQPANVNFAGQMPAILLKPGVQLTDFHRAVFRPELLVVTGPDVVVPGGDGR
ncbi:MAG: hypothetical protein AAF456_16075 [Planctomycetota bacterium]